MRTARIFVFVSLVVAVVSSCSHGFLKDPRLYNPKKTDQEKNAVTVTPEQELQLTGGVDAFDDTEQWFNKSDSNGDEQNPDKLDFPHTDFDQLSLVGTIFNNSNVPVYAMRQENVWVSKNTDQAEFVHANAPNTEGQGYEISNVHWYQYRGKNPLYAYDGNYNTVLQSTSKGNPKLSRFYFYRFTGDTLSPSLDNFLFAVDTYSKLMFAFAKPTASKNVFGNNVPTAWGATDGEPFIGQIYQFYMYDPVGYVEKKDGGYNVVLYQWFSDNLAKGEYQPTLGGKNAKSQGTDYAQVARKSPDGAGKSPFNNHAVDFFAQNMKLLAGATFTSREILPDGGNGLVLYKYTVDKDATKITRTAESWNDLPTTTSLETVVYTIGEGASATSGTLTDSTGAQLTFALQDEALTLVIGETKAYRNFTDYGPDFVQRVKHNPFYKSTDGSTSYTFTDQGKTLVLVIGEKTYTYTYTQLRDEENRNCAVYGSDDSLLKYAGFELSNQDSTIKTSRTSGKWTTTFVWDMTYEAHITYETGDTFKDTVKGKSFSYRKRNESGYELSLMTLKFDSTGSTATLSETKWGGVATDTVTSITVADTGTATKGKLNETEAILAITDDGQWKLQYDSQTYILRYDDPGPSFVNRVRDNNPTFVSSDGKTVYRFSNFGKTLRMTYSGGWLGLGSFDYTYTFVQDASTESSSTARAVYKAENGIAGFSYAGFELSNSDMQIMASRTSGAGAGAFVWDMTYEAQRNGDISAVPSEEDLQAFYDAVKSQTFTTRNVENGVAGLELLTWTFDGTGQAGTLKKKLYPTDTESTVATIGAGRLVALSRTKGFFSADDNTQYTFTIDSDSLLVETSTPASGTTSLTHSKNYEDKGPGFINRVKGKTYVEAGKSKDAGYSYTFSPDGRTCTYKNPSAGFLEVGEASYTYYDAEKRDDSGISAAYNGPYQLGSFGTVWGFKLTASDTTLAGSSAAMADANSILGVSGTFTSKPASLVRTQ